MAVSFPGTTRIIWFSTNQECIAVIPFHGAYFMLVEGDQLPSTLFWYAN